MGSRPAYDSPMSNGTSGIPEPFTEKAVASHVSTRSKADKDKTTNEPWVLLVKKLNALF